MGCELMNLTKTPPSAERWYLVIRSGGGGVEHGERFDALLEGRYSEWDFISAFVSGYGTDQQYLWLEDEG
jgi:hypothetical protein